MRHHRFAQMRPAILKVAMGLPLFTTLCGLPLRAQVSIEIASHSALEISGTIKLELSGNWTNQGSFEHGNGSVTFNGTNGTQTVSGPGGEVFHNLVVYKAAGGVQLLSPVTVNGDLFFGDGNLDLNGHDLTLGPSAYLSEQQGNTIFSTSSGSVVTTRSFNAPSEEDFGGIGVAVMTMANLGVTTIVRSHTPFTSGINTGIKRSYAITPTNNSGLNATLMFTYDDSELNGLAEEDLALFRSTDNGATWTNEGGGVDVAHNAITISGINSLSTWTAAASTNPLPVQLVELAVSAEHSNAALTWKTETETDNVGFEIERRKIEEEENVETSLLPTWEHIGFVKGSGTSASPKAYSFIDRVTLSGRYAYRLKQVNQDGTFSYTESVEAIVSAPEAFALHRNYPNPFNPATRIDYELPKDVPMRLAVYDNLGREVKVLVDCVQPAGYHTAVFDASAFASGMYYCRMETKGLHLTKRILLVK